MGVAMTLPKLWAWLCFVYTCTCTVCLSGAVISACIYTVMYGGKELHVNYIFVSWMTKL